MNFLDQVANITAFMDSDAYHLTIKTQNTADGVENTTVDGENTADAEKGKKIEA